MCLQTFVRNSLIIYKKIHLLDISTQKKHTMIASTYGQPRKISNDSFEVFKKTTIEQHPYSQKFRLSDFEILGFDTILHKPTKCQLILTKKATEDLLSFFKMTSKQTAFLQETIGEQNTVKFVETLRKLFKEGSDRQFAFLINKSNNQILRISKYTADINIATYFDVLDRFVQSNNIDSVLSIPKEGIVVVNTLASKDFLLKEISVDESYKSGASFAFYNNQIISGTYLLRMICTNGLYENIEQNTTNVLRANTKTDWQNFYSNYQNMKSNNFVDTSLFERIVTAHKTTASLNELVKFSKLVKKSINLLEIQDKIEIDSVLKTFDDSAMLELDTKRQQHIRTPFTVKELVDTLTDISTHTDYKIDATSRKQMNDYAMQLITKPKDLEFANIKQIY